MKVKTYWRSVSHKLKVGEYMMINPSVGAEVELEDGETLEEVSAKVDRILNREFLKAAVAELIHHRKLGKAEFAGSMLEFYKAELRKSRIPYAEGKEEKNA
jgi:hypothetical protein